MKTPEELTEDWKAGKLKGWFWIKMGDDIFPYYLSWHNITFLDTNKKEVSIEVLAPVPDYEELRAIQDELAEHRHYCCCMENEVMRLDKAKLEEENKQLRALLKECQNYIINTPVLEQGSEQKTKQIHNLLTRINEVLK